MLRTAGIKGITAFVKGQPFKQKYHLSTGDKFYYRDNLIAIRVNMDIYIHDCGWQTKLTQHLLQQIPAVKTLTIKQGQWYLNGVEWNGSWVRLLKGNEGHGTCSWVYERPQSTT